MYRRVLKLLLIAGLSFLLILTADLLVSSNFKVVSLGVKEATAKDTKYSGKHLIQQGRIQYETGQFNQAVKTLQSASQIFETQTAWSPLAATLTNLGRAQYASGDSEAALKTWKRAAKIYQERFNDPIGVNRSQLYQAQALQELGLYPQACATLAPILDLEASICRHQSPSLSEDTIKPLIAKVSQSDATHLQLTSWRVFGDILRVSGRLQESAQVLETLVQYLPETSVKDATTLSVGNTLKALGDREQERALPQKFDFMPWRCQPNPNLPKSASRYYQQADQQYSALSQAASPATRTQAQLNHLRLTQAVNPSHHPNVQSKDLAASIDFASLPPDRTRIYARIQAAKIQSCQQQQSGQAPNWQPLTQSLQIALKEAQTLGDRRVISYVLGNLGGLYEYRAWWLEQKQEINQAENWRQQAIDLTQQALYQTQPSEFADIAYRWQWQLGRLLTAQAKAATQKTVAHKTQKTAEAIAAYEAAVKTLESVRGDLLAINSDVQFSFRDNVEPIYRELVALLLSTQESETPNAPSQANLHKILGESLYYVESLQLAELENFLQCNVQSLASVQRPRLSEQLNPTTELLGRIDQIFQADPTTALIYPILLKDRIGIILKRPGEDFRYHATPVVHETVEATLNQLQAYLKDPSRTNDIRALSHQVYQWLLQPFEDELDVDHSWADSDVKNLVFVLDGSLRNIPMSVLYDESRSRYLLERYSITLSSGLQLLDSGRSPIPIQALAAGLSQKREFSGQTFSALKNVPAELASIEAVVPSDTLLDEAFNRKALNRQLNSTDYSVVHLATHGNFSSDPEDTYVVLSDQKLQARDFNALLQGNTSGRAQPIELLALSACETATGDKRAALGLAGFALRAGARSTLATLWQVNDASTAALMSQFYAKLNQNPGMTKAEALRQVQLSLWKETRQDWEVPFFWAPYVLIGNWL